MNFMKEARTSDAYISATDRRVDARRRGDMRIVTIDGEEVWEVELGAIEGG